MAFITKMFFCASLVMSFLTNSVYCNLYKVTDYGALPNGKTDSAGAFMQAWRLACAMNGGGVLIPQGTFYVSGANFEGPCNGNTVFQNMGTIIASAGHSTQEYWLQFHKVDGLNIFGDGSFDGQGLQTWHDTNSGHGLPPASLRIIQVKNAVIQGVKSLNSKGFHFHISLCENISLRDLSIQAPQDSPNTDGMHISCSSTVEVLHTTIATGDDCISIGDGATNVNISGVTCGPGHGISIGSLGKYENEKDVTGITVRNCTFIGTQNGLRMKTFAPSVKPITVSDVTFADIYFDNVRNPIIIDQHYCPHGSCSHTGESTIQIEAVKFYNIHGTSASPIGVDLQCSKAMPCKDIEFSNLNLRMVGTRQPTTAACSHADNKFLGTNQVPSQCY